MKLKEIGVVLIVIVSVFLFGWCSGRNNGKNAVNKAEIPQISGVTTPSIEKETTPETIKILVPVHVAPNQSVSAEPEIKPIDSIKTEEERTEAVSATLTDWNIKRTYSGILFSDKKVGKVTYNFDVQYNRAGAISYVFDPAPFAKQPSRLRPTIGGEAYTNGQYSFGGGVQYGSFGLNVRALSLKNSKDYAFGIGLQVIF